MAATCVITGYKLGVSSIVIYGFIISGTVFYPPNPTSAPNGTATMPQTTQTTAFQTTDITKANSSDVTTIAEVTSAPLNEFSDCGVPPTKSPKRTLGEYHLSC